MIKSKKDFRNQNYTTNLNRIESNRIEPPKCYKQKLKKSKRVHYRSNSFCLIRRNMVRRKVSERSMTVHMSICDREKPHVIDISNSCQRCHEWLKYSRRGRMFWKNNFLTRFVLASRIKASRYDINLLATPMQHL